MASSQTTEASAITLKWVPLPAPISLPPHSQLITLTVDELESFPCRRCLTDGQMGEKMHLISYNPFSTSAQNSPYQGPGPIFVHSTECASYKGTEVPDQQRKRLLSLRAYDKEHLMVNSAVLPGDGLKEKAGIMLGDENVAYLHVHYAGPGCFAVRVERD